MEEKDSMKQQTEACEKQCESEGVMSEGINGRTKREREIRRRKTRKSHRKI